MLMLMSNEYIHYAAEYGIGRIEFFHSRGNALTSTMLREITSFIRAAGEDPEIKIVMIQSAGEASFCGGASLDELMECDSVKEARDFFMGFAHLLTAIRTCPKLVVVRVQGKVVGGGLGIVAVADLAFATVEASIRLSELSIGLGPFVIGAAVERKIGISAFSELTYLSSIWKDAHWAKEKGLFSAVFETLAALDIAMAAQIIELETYAPEAIALTKKMFWAQTPEWSDELEKRAGYSAKLWIQKKTR